MKLPKLNAQRLPLVATIAITLLLYLLGCLLFRGFFSGAVMANFVIDNAVLGVAAVGLTFVILSGGIDLSVGAVVGCSSILIASLIERGGWHPLAVLPLVLFAFTLLGAGMGALIHFFALPPFLVTLGGLFLCRGVGLLISTESLSITHPLYQRLCNLAVPVGGGVWLSLVGVIFLAVLAIGIYLSIYTRFGRNAFAIGGSEQSAVLMGLPVGPGKVGLYALSGFCSALAGIACTIYMGSGNAIGATGLELDAIAAVVIGGTLLSGGVGSVFGTLFGVLVFGIIQTAITFQGTLSSWWTKIAIGLLLLAFILLQKLIQRTSRA